MAHPQMFRDDDPLLARVRELALALPEAAEKVSHGRPAFYTTKMFAYFGGSERRATGWSRRPPRLRSSGSTQGVQHEACLLLRPDPTERAALVEDERVFLPAYLHAWGWIGFQLPPVWGRADAWAEVGELLDASYRMTAHPRLVAELDARG